MVKFIVSALNLSEDKVCYISYTGKAAKVLQEKGCPNAMTAHKLLYKSFPRADGTFYRMPRIITRSEYSLIVVDEVSMLPKEMWDLLLSHRIPVICLGDPFQLPPIGEDNEILNKPHIFLDEIMRQAQESEIIRLTMDIRAGKSIHLEKGQEVQILRPEDLSTGMLLWADQIIVGKNNTRRIINNKIRNLIFDTDDSAPVVGDKIIALQNDWERFNEAEDVIVNGSIGTIEKIALKEDYFQKPKLYVDFFPNDYTKEDLETSPFDLVFRGINVDYKFLTSGEKTVNEKNYRYFSRKNSRPMLFDYGYCITCHKSQGSEYNKVLVFEEFLKDSSQHSRWLYTAATRAKEKLVILKDFK